MGSVGWRRRPGETEFLFSKLCGLQMRVVMMMMMVMMMMKMMMMIKMMMMLINLEFQLSSLFLL